MKMIPAWASAGMAKKCAAGKPSPPMRNFLASAKKPATSTSAAANGYYEVNRKTVRNLDWRLQLGLWTWYSADGGIVSPALALHIIVDRTAFILQGGVTPWHYSTEHGNQSESFVHAGIVYMNSDRVGFSVGGFRGWEFITATDSWSFKTTGLAAGVVFVIDNLEVSPKLSYSNVAALNRAPRWLAGGMLTMSFNLN